MITRRRVLSRGLLGGCAALAATALPVQAQTYPSQTVRMIVPFAPGGLNDTTARLLQPTLEKALGQTVIVDNRPAASGIVGTDAVAKASPDGHSLLVVASSHAVVPATNPKVPYNIERDLAAIALVSKNPFFFVVNSKVPAKTLQEFVALAKKEPDKYNYSSPGAAGHNHLVTALFSRRAGISLQHVPYRGGAPAIQSLVAGDTHFAVISPLAALPHIKAGAVRVLAAGGLERDKQFPDIPTVAESGYPGFEAVQWVGMLTTGGTPKPIVDRLNAEIRKVLARADIKDAWKKQGAETMDMSPEQFGEFLRGDIQKWASVVKGAGIKVD